MPLTTTDRIGRRVAPQPASPPSAPVELPASGDSSSHGVTSVSREHEAAIASVVHSIGNRTISAELQEILADK